MKSLIGIGGFFGVLLAGIAYGSPLSVFIDYPSLLFVLGMTSFLSLTKFSLAEICSFSEDVASGIIHFSLISGGLGFVIGLIQSLQNMSDPTALGPAMALSMLAIFYSIVLAAVVFALKKKLAVKKLGVSSLVAASVTLLPMILVMFSFK